MDSQYLNIVIPGRELLRASPESITTAGSMDSGPAPSGASRNDGVGVVARTDR
jgi:hypothetical protein